MIYELPQMTLLTQCEACYKYHPLRSMWFDETAATTYILLTFCTTKKGDPLTWVCEKCYDKLHKDEPPMNEQGI